MIHFSSELSLKELTMQIWFYGLFYFEILSRGFAEFAPITSIYSYVCLFSLSQYKNHHILCFDSVDCFCWCKKKKKKEKKS